MDITSAVYSFHYDKVIIKEPFEIERETDKCYFVKNRRYLKSEIGKPVIKYTTSYPYVEITMIDADEETLRDGLSKWFTDKAYEVWKIKM